MRFIGVDLAGSPRRPTGLALMDEGLAVICGTARDDATLQETILGWGKALVAIDAPLSLPQGRCCLEATCPCATYGIAREADRALRRAGIAVLWTGLPSMVPLTRRGIALRTFLEGHGYQVIEVYPGAAQDILGLGRKKQGKEKLRAALWAWGLRGDLARPDLTHHELDAVTAALVGHYYLAGDYSLVGDAAEGVVVLPTRDWLAAFGYQKSCRL